MACASTVAVVVPSPATSPVLLATSRTICAPMFSNLSASSISLATLTPSLVTLGAPQLFSMTTLRPLGPRVTFTAFASVCTPRRMRSWASRSYRIALAAMVPLLFHHSEEVALSEDQMLFTVDLDLGPPVLREEDAVARLHLQRAHLPIVEDRAVSDSDDLSFDRFLLGRIRNDDPALRLLFFLHTLDEKA